MSQLIRCIAVVCLLIVGSSTRFFAQCEACPGHDDFFSSNYAWDQSSLALSLDATNSAATIARLNNSASYGYINSFSLEGADAQDFELKVISQSTSSAQVSISFAPLQMHGRATRYARLVASHSTNSNGSSQSILNISGNLDSKRSVIFNTKQDLGKIKVGEAFLQSYSIENHTSSAVRISDLSLTGSDAFFLMAPTVFDVEAGKTWDIGIHCNATSPMRVEGTLRFTDDHCAQEHIVPIFATASAPASVISRSSSNDYSIVSSNSGLIILSALNAPFSYTVFDVMGRELISAIRSETASAEIDAIASGFYLIAIEDHKGSTVLRFAKAD